MRRLLILASVLLLLSGASGCGGNPRDEELRKALNYYGAAADDVQALKTTLNKAVAKLDTEKSRTDAKLTLKDLESALKEVDKVREDGKNLVKVKAEIDRLKDTTDKAEREELAKRYRNDLEGVIVRLNKAQAELDVALVAVKQRAEDDAWKSLEKAIKTSREEFEGLTKQR